MYVLRVEIELDPRDCLDDVAARQAAKDLYSKLNLGKPENPSGGVKVKLQKRSDTAPPRLIRFLT